MLTAGLKVATVIASLYDELFNEGHVTIKDACDRNLAVHFVVRVAYDNYGYELDGTTHHDDWERSYHTFIHVIITSGHRAYVGELSSPFLKQEDLAAFSNTSNHDSCWRSDGLRMIDRILDKAYSHCEEGSPEEHKANAVATWVNIDSTYGRVFNFVKIKRGPYVDDRCYFDSLSGVELVRDWKISFGEQSKNET